MSYPLHIQNMRENLSEIEKLINIHTQVAGSSRGRKSDVEVLNKSAIVLLTACWENYIEDLVKEAFNYLLLNAEEHTAFPNSVLAKASKELKNDRDDRRVWELAGTGWQNVLKNYQDTTLIKEIDHFHVPRPTNIDELYNKLLGIQNITTTWNWQKMSNESAIETLNNFIDLRGEIAHSLKTKKSVTKKDVRFYSDFIKKTSIILHNRVNTHLEKQIGKKAWRDYVSGKVK